MLLLDESFVAAAAGAHLNSSICRQVQEDHRSSR